MLMRDVLYSDHQRLAFCVRTLCLPASARVLVTWLKTSHTRATRAALVCMLFPWQRRAWWHVLSGVCMTGAEDGRGSDARINHVQVSGLVGKSCSRSAGIAEAVGVESVSGWAARRLVDEEVDGRTDDGGDVYIL